MTDQKEHILAVLSQEKRPITISAISEKSGLHRHAVARHLDVLEVLGKVRKIQKGTAKKYLLVESLPVSGLIDISSDLIVIINQKMEIQYVNNAALQYFSLQPSQIIGENLKMGTLPLFSTQAIIDELRGFSFKKSIKNIFQSKDGIWFEITILGISLQISPQLIALIATDITEQKNTEEKLKKSERHFRLIAESMKDVFSIMDPKTLRHRYVSPSITRLLGYSPEEFLTIPFDQIVDPSQAEWLKNLAGQRQNYFFSTRDINHYYTDQFLLISKAGSRVLVESIYRFIINEDTGELEIIGVSREIERSLV
jgi:PAS domain S-box-containing protein